jgi:hypothetical protein
MNLFVDPPLRDNASSRCNEEEEEEEEKEEEEEGEGEQPKSRRTAGSTSSESRATKLTKIRPSHHQVLLGRATALWTSYQPTESDLADIARLESHYRGICPPRRKKPSKKTATASAAPTPLKIIIPVNDSLKVLLTSQQHS